MPCILTKRMHRALPFGCEAGGGDGDGPEERKGRGELDPADVAVDGEAVGGAAGEGGDVPLAGRDGAVAPGELGAGDAVKAGDKVEGAGHGGRRFVGHSRSTDVAAKGSP